MTHHARRPRVLVIAHDVVGSKMAGPGIRSWELCRVLARHAHVSLAAPGGSDLAAEGVTIVPYGPGAASVLAIAAAQANAVIAGIDILRRFPSIAAARTPLAIELTAPVLLENFALHQGNPDGDRERLHAHTLVTIARAARRGDFFTCETDRQRDWWLGLLAAFNRVRPCGFDQDATFRSLIDVVPHGLPSVPFAPPVSPWADASRFGGADRVILWGGGVWNWLDPLTPIRAMSLVREREPNARLVFLAGRHPNPAVPAMTMVARARRLAADMGLVDREVVFVDRWIDYDERCHWLNRAAAAVCTSGTTVESRFALRTRLLDAIWAGLPVIVSGGDTLADLVQERSLGRVVPPEDPRALAMAILDVLGVEGGRRAWESAFDKVRAAFSWELAAQPLVRFCRAPHVAADRELPANWRSQVQEGWRRVATLIGHEGLAAAARVRRRLGMHLTTDRGSRSRHE